MGGLIVLDAILGSNNPLYVSVLLTLLKNMLLLFDIMDCYFKIKFGLLQNITVLIRTEWKYQMKVGLRSSNVIVAAS